MGSLVGALVGAGMDEYRAKRFAKTVEDDGIIVGAHTSTVPEQMQVERVVSENLGKVLQRAEDTSA